jgi:type I restriction enzyme S subunit
MNKKISLKELCLEDEWGKYGIPASAEDYDSEKTRYLRITDISEDGELLNNDKKSVSAPDIDKYLLKDGDIVFARTGNSTGKSYYHEDKNGKLAFAGFLIKYSLDKAKVNPKYIKFFTITNEYKNWVKNLSVGSTRGNINAQTFGDCPISVPERKQQDLLVRTLSLIIDKIELNNRINAELEAMAKTLYDYWFVQFDFPDKNGKPYKTSGGKMVWNEELKREIPEGWEDGTFANYCPSTGGFAFKSNWWTDKGVAVAKIKDIQENYTLDTSDLARVDISDKEIDDKFLAKPGDVLIAMTGATVGKYAIVPITDYPIYVNQRVGYFNLGIDPTQKLPFLINSMNQSYFRNAIFTLANGAAQPNISNEQINSIQLLIPEDKLINTFNEMFQPYYKKILNNQLENQKLTELRDWLLPMLMNGQVKVMDKVENELSMAAEAEVKYGK